MRKTDPTQQTPLYILKMIRQRMGLGPDDTQLDDEIAQMSPKEKLHKVVGWELGDDGWADQFLTWAQDCGVKFKGVKNV